MIDAASNTLKVEDNGQGFSSLRDVGANRTSRDIDRKTPYSGFGLGLSSVVSRSDYFSIVSVNSKNELHRATWENVYSSIRSTGKLSSLLPTSFEGPTPATTKDKIITTITAGGNEGFSELWSLALNDPQRLYEILLCHTALGHTSHIWKNGKKLNCNFHVVIKGGANSIDKKLQLGFPSTEVGAADTFDYEQYDKSKKLPKGTPLIIYKRQGRKSPMRPFKFNLYVACEVERGQHIPKKFGNYIESQATNRILLSVDGFLQSFTIERPAERATRALWGNIFAIVDSSTNIVEPGRNKIADKFIHIINEQLIDAIKHLDKLVSDIRDRDAFSNPIDIGNAKKDAEFNANQKPLNRSIGVILHMLKDPEDEQEVIGLFCELLGHNLIDGCDVIRIGGSASVYDAYLRYRYKWGEVGINIRPKKDEGKRKLDLTKERETTLATEFKSSAHKLVNEILTGKTRKKLDQIDLLICWQEGPIPTGYTLKLLDEEDRFFSAATHVLSKDGGSRGEQCEALILSDFLDDVEAQLSS